MDNQTRITLRARKIGVLLRDARLSAGKTIAECAKLIGVSSGTYRAYEFGEKIPSLPEIEVLAYALNVPLEHFWGRETRSSEDEVQERQLSTALVALRQRIIGALLRQHRESQDVPKTELGRAVGVSARTIRAYELGDKPIPLPHLEIFAEVLDIPFKEFMDREGPVGQWLREQQLVEAFLRLPPELQDFVTHPVNRPYLELAQRLSEMNVDKLRAVAEGLLDITL